jgi:hypothetical protein
MQLLSSHQGTQGKATQLYQHRARGLIIREIGDEFLILDTVTDQVHQLNRTAAFVWHHLQEPREPEQISEALAQQYEISAECALQDVTEMILQLRTLNLIDEIAETELSREERDNPRDRV